MRTGPGFTSNSPSAAAQSPTEILAMPAPYSTWESPIPFLFAGLAAMLGLVAFALLILLCSYWRFSGYLDEGSHVRGESDDRSNTGTGYDVNTRTRPCFGQGFVVIMAGEQKPTFLATPVACRTAAAAAAALTGEGDITAAEKSEQEPVVRTDQAGSTGVD